MRAREEPQRLRENGTVEDFSVGPKKISYTQSDLKHPADLYEVGFAGGRPDQVTHVNQAALANRGLGEYEQFSFPGWNNENVFGYLVKPANFKSGERYPVAFVVHGGPQGSLANVSGTGAGTRKRFAGAGYAVVMIDFHGSTGYGQAFTDSISGDWGGKPFDDLKLGLAAALKRYPWLDAEHMCALGGSYGGYMMNWMPGPVAGPLQMLSNARRHFRQPHHRTTRPKSCGFPNGKTAVRNM